MSIVPNLSADTSLAVTMCKPMGKSVPRRHVIVENLVPFLAPGNLLSTGLLAELFSWTDMSSCREDRWSRLDLVAPTVSKSSLSSKPNQQIWQQFVDTLDGVTIKPIYNCTLDWRPKVFAPRTTTKLFVTVYIWTQEYFEIHTRDSLYDIVESTYNSQSLRNWRRSPQRSLAEHFAAGEVQVQQRSATPLPQEVCVLNFGHGRLNHHAQGYTIPRVG